MIMKNVKETGGVYGKLEKGPSPKLR